MVLRLAFIALALLGCSAPDEPRLLSADGHLFSEAERANAVGRCKTYLPGFGVMQPSRKPNGTICKDEVAGLRGDETIYGLCVDGRCLAPCYDGEETCAIGFRCREGYCR